MARPERILEATGEIEEERPRAAGAEVGVDRQFFSVEVYRRDLRTYVAACPEMDVYSYGRTVDQAVERLKKVVSFYLESADEMGLSLGELGLKEGEPDAPAFPRTSKYKDLEALH